MLLSSLDDRYSSYTVTIELITNRGKRLNFEPSPLGLFFFRKKWSPDRFLLQNMVLLE